MAYKIVLTVLVLTVVGAVEEFKDFEFQSDPGEMMIAQESRYYQTIVKPPVKIVKPIGVTNSHRPQYNLDSIEDEPLLENPAVTTKRTVTYTPSYKLRSKEGMIKEAVLKALERKDHVGKFAQILPIIRAMSGNQRVALASLVASQVTTPPGRAPLNLVQVRSMFGNDANITSDLMLPILLDMANLIRRAVSPGKQLREIKQPLLPQAQMLRRSFTEDMLDEESFEVGYEEATRTTTRPPFIQRIRNRRIIPQRSQTKNTADNLTDKTNIKDTKMISDTEITNTTLKSDDKNSSKISTSTEATATVRSILNISRVSDNSTLDLAADSTNQTLAQDLPVAEKLRALNRYTDRKGSLFRRGSYSPKPPVRRTTAEPTISPIRRRPLPARKLPTPSEQAKCELFTNSLCLHADDYPMDVIIQTIRRNKAAAGALLADYRDPGDGALDGVTAAQEAKYTADHYLVSNRRGDTANRDFAGAGEAGFMCPSVVKYARPQRARATSGQWKYIVNTGEHTQTLRLEKCLKPKESCTYLTDNFKSKCVQVYNYHRLLTWDQQNGLHMDIFKVPTCCSCHIEGYSVSFPPLGHRVHETSSEHFPGEDLSSEHGNHAFEAVQSTIHRPNIKTQGFTHSKQLESFPSFSENHELLAGIPFSNAKLNDNDEIVINTGKIPQSNPMDSYGNTYFPDSFNQASSIRNVKRPLPGRTPVGSNNFVTVTLPSYLEPPTPSGPSSFNFIKETPNQLKTTGGQFKRGPIRPSRLPIRKKISGGPDLISSGTSSVGSLPNSNADSLEELDNSEEPNIVSVTANVPRRVTIAPKLQAVTTEKIVKSFRPQEQNNEANENFSSSGKRVNYNYHPIIDFFGAEEKDEANESIDREDTVSSYEPTESEWKPINHPPSRNSQSSNVIGRKKH
ncbi:neurotrophin 1 isoform X1 [Galleria mellonella]|uniref:Neurotrophin 1 isoform X1 n=1 Tax=Galleria mellonella TaxID=7137 RepID=A0ABM3MQF0_GALME|nr:neurotrophin 1 isoform X1 [Galleria mellonella]